VRHCSLAVVRRSFVIPSRTCTDCRPRPPGESTRAVGIVWAAETKRPARRVGAGPGFGPPCAHGPGGESGRRPDVHSVVRRIAYRRRGPTTRHRGVLSGRRFSCVRPVAKGTGGPRALCVGSKHLRETKSRLCSSKGRTSRPYHHLCRARHRDRRYGVPDGLARISAGMNSRAVVAEALVEGAP
jgi:hypothetical protein